MTGVAAEGAAALVAALGDRVGVAVFDAELRAVVVAPALAALRGSGEGPSVGREARELLPHRVSDTLVAAIEEVRDGEATYRAFPRLDGGDGRSFRAGCYRLRSHGGVLVGVAVAETTSRTGMEARLRANRERLAAAERLAHLGAWTWRAEAPHWTWSEHLCDVADLPGAPEQAPFEAWARELAPGSEDVIFDAQRRVLAGDAFDVTLPHRSRDGARRMLRAQGVPTHIDGRLVRVDGVLQDVTELERAAARERVVADLARSALAGTTVEGLLDRCTRWVAEALDVEHVTMWEIDQDAPVLAMRAAGAGRLTRGDAALPVLPGSRAALALHTGEPVLVEDWEKEQRFPLPPAAAGLDIRSGAVVPIAAANRTFGMLGVESSRPSQVDAGDLAFLRAVANILGSALERLRLEDELSAQAAARGRLVAQALDAEDATRRLISEALHDGPLQDVLALHQVVARMEAPGGAEGIHLERAKAALSRAVDGLRDVMLELHPVVLDVGGLESALGAIAAQQAERGGFHAEVRVAPDATSARDELVVSVARELLVNVARHADARRVEVTVERLDAEVVLTVLDDGRGIPDGRSQAAVGEGHIGLASTRQRAEAVGGHLTIDGGPSAGTRVTAVLPV